MKMQRLHQIGARADDFNATRQFYEDILGARYIETFDPPGLMFFEFSGVRLLFERDNEPATLYFWVNDIDEAHEQLNAKGVVFENPPHLIHRDELGTFGKAGEEEWMAFFKDPGGNTLALATRM